MRTLSAIAMCIVLTACSGVGTLKSDGQENVGPYPANWKNIIASYIRNNYVDPHSIIDSEAAPPFRNQKLFYDTWTVCIRNNAKNRFGGYTGRQITAIGIKHGQIDLVEENEKYDCERVKFEPFPLN
ncbi:MAG: hypothetical protein Q7J38_07705 [Gallionella sp.]|nr:hypothetical protein [Gallionella sp.]